MAISSIAGAILASMAAKAFGSGLNQAMSRNDYMFTHRMEAAPQQVKEMMEAGLNPALAYGQLSAPSGQALGNYQQDYGDIAKLIQENPIVREEFKHKELENDILAANAEYLKMKTRNEALMLDFDRTHQQDRYDLEIQGKGLVNAGQLIQNRGYQLDNKNKLIQNEILGIEKDIREYDRQMKSLDADYHEDYLKSELSRIRSNIFLSLSEARALNAKLPLELKNLAQATKNLKGVLYEMHANGKSVRELNKATKEKIISSKEFQDLQNELERYMKSLGMESYANRKFGVSEGLLQDFIDALFDF